MSYADAELDVIRWAEARKIIQNSNIQAQARKTLEEAGWNFCEGGVNAKS